MTLTALPADKLLVLYCDCLDDSESAIMALELKSLRYDIDKVMALSQGFAHWKELGYPTEK